MKLEVACLFALAVLPSFIVGSPEKIYGVNLGGWLVAESWMFPEEWVALGGEFCDDCTTCISTEFDMAKAYPDSVDQRFAKHWSTWFTQDHVNQLKNVGINTVRLPLGYWIIEDLVDRSTEYFPRGGLKYLINGLKMLRDADIQVILDHHALPGAQATLQMFAGRCTRAPQFYTPYNYGRALTWTAVMTGLTHLHPEFSSVYSIEAVNEPLMNATMTPGFGDFQHNFVQTVRAMERLLGVGSSSPSTSFNLTRVPTAQQIQGLFNPAVAKAVIEAIPILVRLGLQLGIPGILDVGLAKSRSGTRKPITTSFMDYNWQNTPDRPNPALAADGPQAYDDHLYYNYGGVADPNPTAYLTSICNTQRIEIDAAHGNTPMWTGEWAITAQFTPTDAFLNQWADAQKLAWSKAAGWIFWNFRVEDSETTRASDLGRYWSYLEGVERGYLTKDPSQYHDPHVCDPYRRS
ncbi:glycoside hydrolase family 5 protein [Amylostereum chailletii]|nr:glycoside hydrolase family 5 protein [Amylostereum chailletii]